MYTIVFTEPSINPTTDEQQDKWDYLRCLLEGDKLSGCVGWIIRMRERFDNKELLDAVRRPLQGHFQGRFLSNWTLVALCAKEVSSYSCTSNVLIQSKAVTICALASENRPYR